MTKQEMAGGVIEYARKQGIALRTAGDQVVAHGPLPGFVLAALLVACRAEIVAALKRERDGV